jgi:hypothetical protein
LRSRFERPKNLYVAFVGRQHDDLRVPKFSPNRRDGIEAVHLGHLQVHNRDIRPMRAKLLDCLAPIRGFRDQSHIWFVTEQDSYAFPNEDMIVNCKNPDSN